MSATQCNYKLSKIKRIMLTTKKKVDITIGQLKKGETSKKCGVGNIKKKMQILITEYMNISMIK